MFFCLQHILHLGIPETNIYPDRVYYVYNSIIICMLNLNHRFNNLIFNNKNAILKNITKLKINLSTDISIFKIYIWFTP